MEIRTLGWLLMVLTAAACVGSDDTTTPDASPDVGVKDSAPSDSSSPTDASLVDTTPTDGSPTSEAGDASDAAVEFCLSAQAQNAAFCDDFETDTTVQQKWDSIEQVEGTTVLDNAFGSSSSRSAFLTLNASTDGNEEAGLVKVVTPSSSKSKLVLAYDMYVEFQTWDTTKDYEYFFTFVMNGALFDGGYTNYYVDVERDLASYYTTTDNTKNALPTITTGTWHHIVETYDSSAYPTVTLDIAIDGTDHVFTLPTSAQTGGPPLVSFKSVTIEPLSYSDGIAPMTQTHYDNILLTFP
jgi:hypothetical protein